MLRTTKSAVIAGTISEQAKFLISSAIVKLTDHTSGMCSAWNIGAGTGARRRRHRMEQRLINANKIYSDVQNSASDTDTEKDMKALFRYLLRTAQTVLTIPDNPTNGNMIKAMFPNVAIRVVTESQIGISFFNNQNEITWIPIDWWNAPYEKEEEE